MKSGRFGEPKHEMRQGAYRCGQTRSGQTGAVLMDLRKATVTRSGGPNDGDGRSKLHCGWPAVAGGRCGRPAVVGTRGGRHQ